MDNKIKTALISVIIGLCVWVIQNPKQPTEHKTQAWATITLALGFVAPSPYDNSRKKREPRGSSREEGIDQESDDVDDPHTPV